MERFRVSLACRGYDRTEPIIRGQVKPEEFDLQIRDMTGVPVPRIFAGMFKGQYDVSEFSLAELAYYTSRNASEFIGIPVFLYRIFRHQFIFCNTASKISRPEDLDGKKIAFPRLIQTATIWIRGLLTEEYGVSPKNSEWYAASVHHWEDDHPKHELIPNDGSTIQPLEKHGKDEDQASILALSEGRVDALGTTRVPQSLLSGDVRVKRLFENYRAVEIAYIRRPVFSRSCISWWRGGLRLRNIPTCRGGSLSCFRKPRK